MANLRLRAFLAALLAGCLVAAASAKAPAPHPAQQLFRVVLGPQDTVYLKQQGEYVWVATSVAGLAKAKRFSRTRTHLQSPLHVTLPRSGPWQRVVLEICDCPGVMHLYPECDLRDKTGATWRYELLPPKGKAPSAPGAIVLAVPPPGGLKLAVEVKPVSHAQGAARIGLVLNGTLGGWDIYDTSGRAKLKPFTVNVTDAAGRRVFTQTGTFADFAYG